MSCEKYDDDEFIVDPTAPDDDDSGENTLDGALEVGKVPVKFKNEPEVPKDDTKYQLLLELTGKGAGNARLGADIVVVLDVSKSMAGVKLIEMKRAMQFVIRKLSPSDRLSIVTFSTGSKRQCGLRQMTPKAQEEVDFLVQNLKVHKNTNISSGLQKALKILEDRKYTTGRSAAIMLMSDGQENRGNATQISVDRFPIFTFGFGHRADPQVLTHIAENSNGGTFSIANPGQLSVVFSQCLGGLLSVLVQDVELILEPLTGKVSKRENVTTEIKMVNAGNYPQSTDDATGSVTVSFGNLYQKEIRKVLVELFLPKITNNPDKPTVDLDALEISCSYRGESGNLTKTNPQKFRVKRSTTPKMKLSDATKAEIKRVEIVELMKDARTLADQNNLEEALDKIEEGKTLLNDLVLQKPNPVIETLKYELDEMSKFFQNEDAYENKGRSFSYSSETSHDRQRFASRGDVEKMRCYATPRMDTYLEQAKKFEEDPRQPVPTAAEDEKQELAADPLATVSPTFDYYLQIAIEALKSIQKVVNQKP